VNSNDDTKTAELISTAEVAEMLGLTPRALAKWAAKGHGPQRYLLTPRCARYKRHEVLEWIEKSAG
jgi:predicted DNA-binding transcriptional regulator AlpA